MDGPPPYANASYSGEKYPPTSQQPQGFSAFRPASTSSPAVQPGFSQAQPLPDNGNIFMMGLLPFEKVQTPNGVKMVRRILGKTPSTLLCQFCNERIETKVEEGSIREMLTDSEWGCLKCASISMLVFSPCSCFIPLCIYFALKPLSMVKHTCPRSNTCLGTHYVGSDQFFYTYGSPEAQYAPAAAMVRQIR